MSNALKIAPPPPRRSNPEPEPAPPAATPKFSQVKEDGRVQFNKRVTRRVADGFEMLAIRTHKKMPDLLAEALELLEERYGKV
jgi:hypothetical protein